MSLPHPIYLSWAIRTSLMVWIGIRTLYVVVLFVGVIFFGIASIESGVSAAIRPDGIARIAFIVVTALLVDGWRRRLREHLLILNTGSTAAWVRGAAFACATSADAVVQAILSMM